MKTNHFLSILLIISTLLSCNYDEDIDLSNPFIGEWIRSDVNDTFEFKLIFNTDNTGATVIRHTMETTITSSFVPFEWNAKESTLTIIGINEFNNIDYSFNSEDQLVLASYPGLVFNRAK